MLKILLVFLVIPFITTAQLKLPESQQTIFTPEDMLSLNRLSDANISPDGEWILYTLSTPNIENASMETNIYAIKKDGSETIKVTKSRAKDYHPRWIEDGKKIAFLSTRMGSPQIFTKVFPDGVSEGLTTVVKGIGDFKYSPDGSLIAYTSSVKTKQTIKDKYPDLRNTNVMHYENLPVRSWDKWEDENRNHIFVMPASGGTGVDIMKTEDFDSPTEPFGGGDDFTWKTNSREIIYVSKKVDKPAISTNSDLYVYSIESKETTNITSENLGYDKHPIVSPDGRYVAYTSQERPGFEADKVRLMIYEFATGLRKDLTKDLDQWVVQFAWANNSKTIYFSATEKGREPLFKVDVESSKIDKIAGGDYNYSSGLLVSPDDKTLYVGRTSMQEAVNIYTYPSSSTDSKMKSLTNVNAVFDARVKNVKMEEKWVKTTDGKQMQVWVLLPPDFDENKKYPMITYCQGGPQGQISQYFSYRWNMFLMASQGYVVCAPNRRGMPGFGQEWNDQISRDWGGQAMKDILSATDAVAKETYVDNEKLTCVGPSFGGYSVFWLAAHHDKRFKAFISHCGVFNLYSMYGSTEELFFPNWEQGGPYWDSKSKKDYEKFSPHNFVEKWDTPMLIITGGKDFRVPYAQSLEAFTACQAQGIPSKLLFFPEENHWVLNLQNALVWQKEFFEWLKIHTK